MIMELQASLTIVSPDGPNDGAQVTVRGVGDVPGFVARLAGTGMLTSRLSAASCRHAWAG
jgi:hypothetical protein